MSSRRKRLMWWSIGLAAWSTIGLAAMCVVLATMPNRVDVAAIGAVMHILSLIPSLIGLGLGVATFDRRSVTSGIVWIGIVVNGLVLVSWLILIVASLAT